MQTPNYFNVYHESMDLCVYFVRRWLIELYVCSFFFGKKRMLTKCRVEKKILLDAL